MKHIDLTNLDIKRRLEEMTTAFNELSDGDSFTISANESLMETVQMFQSNFWTEYNFMPLVSGPSIWKSRITKRDEKNINAEKIHHFMSIDHALCDHLYADGEAAILDGRIDEGKEMLSTFGLAMERHFVMEEDLFFPAFEQRTGMTGGPTQVMRMEHLQMRGVLRQMADALSNNDTDTAIALGDTMLILIQQHNMKEEGMLYPMADNAISDISEDLLKRMQLIKA